MREGEIGGFFHMPTRLIHEELLTSPSLLRCSPRARDSFHRLILVADDFGCFEADLEVLRGRGWAKCSDVSLADLSSWLREWCRERMVFLWEERRRYFGYVIAWHGPHGQRWRVEYKARQQGGTSAEQRGSKRKTPRPPGWTGAAPAPWVAPVGWTPGEVWADDGAASRPTSENLSLFLPGREESREGAVSRPPDAVAVQDAVAGAAAAAVGSAARAAALSSPDAAPAGMRRADDAGAVPSAQNGSGAVPSEAPRAAAVWPKTEEVRKLISQGLGGQQNGGHGLRSLGPAADRDAFESDVAKVGVLAAASACIERALEQGKGGAIRSLAYFREFVHELAAPASPHANGAGTARNGKPRCFAPVSDFSGVKPEDYLKPRTPNGAG